MFYLDAVEAIVSTLNFLPRAVQALSAFDVVWMCVESKGNLLDAGRVRGAAGLDHLGGV